MNAFGEEVIIDNAEQALEHACNLTSSSIEDYTAAPIYLTHKEAGKHQWLIEFRKKPNDLAQFTHYLDEKLKELNSDYEAKRKGNMALELPLVQPMPDKTFYNWMKKKNKLGSQNKVPRLSNTREHIEDILAMNQIV